jgi:putative spermidine/putrescine transport system permease protein
MAEQLTSERVGWTLAERPPPVRRWVAARAPVDGWALLPVPGLVFLFLVFGVPVLIMVASSLTDPSPANYSEAAQDPLVVRSLLFTIQMALIVTGICLLLGYACAYLMNSAGPRLRLLLLVFVVVPFWSSLLVRTYAWTVILRDSGLLNQLLLGAHLVNQPVPLMRTQLGATIGMVHVLLPFMVLPIYATMQQIDAGLTKAAEGLGAHPIVAFLRVFLPLSLPGVLAGCLLVFVVALGFYITPAVLGSARQPMFSQVIVLQSHVLLNVGAAAAMAVILLGLTLAVIGIGSRFVNVGRTFGLDEGG